MKKILGFLAASALLLPAMAFAAPGGGTTIGDILDVIYDILNALVPILIILATIFFFYGLARFILSAGDESARSNGIQIMIYGVIALFVIVSVWGLVALLQNTFGIQDNAEAIEGPGDTNSLVPDAN